MATRTAAVSPTASELGSTRRLAGVWKRLVSHPSNVIGLVLVVGLLLIATVGRLIAPYDPLKSDFSQIVAPPGPNHLLGTDFLGRDVLSRIIYGAGISIFVGVAAVVLALIPGMILGVVAAYRGGRVDDVNSLFFDTLMALPSLVLAMTIVSIVGPSLFTVIIAIAITSLPFYGRLVRGQVLAVRSQEYILAAKSVGLTSWRIMFRYVLPNSISPALVQASLGVGFAITAEASLSFLGLGVQPPAPTWGSMIQNGFGYLQTGPWMAIAPAVMIFLAVVGFNLLGDAIREVLDPYGGAAA